MEKESPLQKSILQQDKIIEALQATINNLNAQVSDQKSQISEQNKQLSDLKQMMSEMAQQMKEMNQTRQQNEKISPPTPKKTKLNKKPEPKPVPTSIPSNNSMESTDFPSLEIPKVQNPLHSAHAELKITPTTPLNIPATSNPKTRDHFENLQSKTDNENDMDTTSADKAKQSVVKTVPITIRDAAKWPQITKDLKNLGCQLAYKPKQVELGIQQSPNDHRLITTYLTSHKLQYHTFLLPEEKMLNIFIRGIGMEINIEDVKNDLINQGFTPTEIYRLKLGRARKPCPTIKILLPKTQENIFNINDILDLPVAVEAQQSNNPNYIKQCKKCQKYGHTEVRCFAAPVCHRCAGPHYYKNCEAVKTIAPTCCNCQGPHPASYSKCPKNPKNISSQKTFTSKKLVPGTSFASMATPQTPAPLTPKLLHPQPQLLHPKPKLLHR